MYCLDKSNKSCYISLNEALKSAIFNNSNIYLKEDIILVSESNNIEIFYNNNLFIVDKKKYKYIDMPIKYYPNSLPTNDLEYHTGCYNYLYSKCAYSKLNSFVSLKNTTFKLSENTTSYNGYVLFNHKINDQIDIGLSIRYINEEVVVQPFYYYMGGVSDKVFYLDKIILAKFKKIDDLYYGQDDFCISLKSTPHGWKFKIDVIDTNISYEKDIYIKENMHNDLVGRFLVGVSLVPIKDDLFDPLCGAFFKDVFIKEILLDNKDYLYPGSESMHEGFSQGYPFADYTLNRYSIIFKTEYK